VQKRKSYINSCSRLRRQFKDQERSLNDAKAALFDLISDVRTKLESDDSLKKEYDSLLKEMVVRTPNQRRSITSDMSDEEAEPTLVQPLIDLVSLIKSLCETLGRNVAY